MLRYDTLKTTAVNVLQGPNSLAFHPQDELLQGLFAAQTGSTYRSNNRRISRKKETADVFHGALSLSGLPMAVILDGCGVAAENEDIQKSARRIMDTLENLALQLQGTQLPENKLKELVKQEYLTLDTAMHGRTEDAVFSAVVVFKDHRGQLKALSFGTGDTMLALDNQIQVKTVIAARNVEEQGFLRPLPFPCPRIGTATLERTLNNLEIDVRSIKSQDRFIFLTDGAYEHLERREDKLTNDDQTTLIRTSLADGALESGVRAQSLANFAENQTALAFNSGTFQKTLSLGDDTTVATVLIPSEQQQHDIQAFLYEKAKKALEQTLADETLPDEIKQKFKPVKDKIYELRLSHSADLPTLTKALIKTNQVITQREDETLVNDYMAYAKKEVSRKTSFLWKALGVAMMAAGGTLALLGGFTLAGTLGLGTAVGGALVAGGLLLAGAGVAFFAQGGKKDLQKDMVEAGQLLQNVRGRVRVI